MPSRRLWWFVEQMPVLQARESIMRINEMAYAFGSFSKEDGSSYYQALRAEAAGPDKPIQQVAPRPTSAAGLAQLLGSKMRME